MEMMATTHPRRRHLARSLTFAALSMMLYGCTGGLSCGGSSGGCINAYDYPQSGIPNGAAAVDDGVRMRMTQAALNFLQQNLQELLIQSFGTSPTNPNLITLDVGPFVINGSSPQVTVGQRPNGSTFPTLALIDATELSERMQFEFVEGVRGGLRVRVVDLPIGLDARFYGEWLSATAACDLDGTSCPSSDPNCGILTDISFDVVVYPDVGVGSQCDPGIPECFLIDVQLESVSLGDIGSGSIEISVPPHDADDCNSGGAPALCEPECSDTVTFVDPGGANECTGLCGAADFLTDLVAALGGVLVDALQGILDDVLEGAIRAALADFDGAPLSAADRLTLSTLAPDLFNPTTLDLGFMVAPTGSAFDVNCPAGVNCEETRGMDFILKSGFEAAPPPAGVEGSVPHPCVNALEGANFAALYGGGEFIAADADPLDGEFEGQPYHLGASLARSAVNQMLFAAYNSGALCIELDSDAIHSLSGGAFPLTAGTLDLLTEGRLRQFAPPSAPAVITVVPSSPPVVSYGAGNDTEGLMGLTWNDAIVSFYVLTYERYARVFAVSTDISAQLSVLADPATETLQISIVDGPNIENFEEQYNELLPGIEFADVLGSLVGLAFDALLTDELAFSYDVGPVLADALGVPIFVDVRGIETVPQAGAREFLNFYLSLSSAQPRTAAVPMTFRLADSAGLYRVAGPSAVVTTPVRPAPTGEVVVVGLGQALRTNDEYFVQVDFGAWRGPLRPNADGKLVIRDAKLSLVGKHTLRLRGRVRGEASTLAPTVAELTVHVDPLRPWAELRVEGGEVRALGSDIGSSPEKLEYAWAENDGPFGAFGSVQRRSLGSLRDVRRLSVQVRDEAGNLSRPVTLNLDAIRARSRTQVP